MTGPCTSAQLAVPRPRSIDGPGSTLAAERVPAPRDPTQGPLHQLLREDLEGYLAARHARPPPPFVQKALRSYLSCGVLWHRCASLEALPPTVEELEALLADIKTRVTSLAQERGLAEPDTDRMSTLLLPGMGELYSDGVGAAWLGWLRHDVKSALLQCIEVPDCGERLSCFDAWLGSLFA